MFVCLYVCMFVCLYVYICVEYNVQVRRWSNGQDSSLPRMRSGFNSPTAQSFFSRYILHTFLFFCFHFLICMYFKCVISISSFAFFFYILPLLTSSSLLSLTILTPILIRHSFTSALACILCTTLFHLNLQVNKALRKRLICGVYTYVTD